MSATEAGLSCLVLHASPYEPVACTLVRPCEGDPTVRHPALRVSLSQPVMREQQFLFFKEDQKKWMQSLEKLDVIFIICSGPSESGHRTFPSLHAGSCPCRLSKPTTAWFPRGNSLRLSHSWALPGIWMDTPSDETVSSMRAAERPELLCSPSKCLAQS